MKLALFLTFVLITYQVQAKPHTHAPPIKQDEIVTGKKETEKYDFENSTVNLVEPTEEKIKKESDFYFPYRQAFSPRLGLLLNPDKLSGDDKEYPLVIGVAYMFPRHRSPQWEVGADLVTNSDGHIHVTLKKIINERNYFRPFYRLGVLNRVEASENLASFVNIDNYQLLGVIGMEDVLKRPMSIRMEAELAIGLEEQFVILSLGYSWAW